MTTQPSGSAATVEVQRWAVELVLRRYEAGDTTRDTHSELAAASLHESLFPPDERLQQRAT